MHECTVGQSYPGQGGLNQQMSVHCTIACVLGRIGIYVHVLMGQGMKSCGMYRNGGRFLLKVLDS